MLLVDATTAQHARGIRTVIGGVLSELPSAASEPIVVAGGPDLESTDGLQVRRVAIAKTRPGRLLYQRVLLPVDVSRLRADGRRIDRVLLLDSYVPFVRPQRRVRYAALVHDLLPLTHPHFWSAPKLMVKRTAIAALRRSGATVFTSSDHNARQVERLLGIRAHSIRFGCGQLSDAEAEAASRAPLPEQEPYLVYVGAVEPRKDVLGLLTAFDLVAATLDPALHLVIVGDGPASYVALVREAIGRSSNGQRIRLIQGADRETTLRSVMYAKALLFPSRAEGFALPILEALALGTPVVASDLPEIRSWAVDAIFYGPPARPAEWVEPVAQALASDTRRRRSGQALAASFRWLQCARDLVAF
jgi:glycosyltransferase involved in cell wall biosynthesis